MMGIEKPLSHKAGHARDREKGADEKNLNIGP